MDGILYLRTHLYVCLVSSVQLLQHNDHVASSMQTLEPCIGCLQTLPEVKLQKLCSDDMEVLMMALLMLSAVLYAPC